MPAPPRQDVGRVIAIFGQLLEGCDPQIDLAHLEPGDLDTEIESEQREVLELLGEQPVVPGGDLGQPIVSDHERAGLGRAQVIEAEGRYFGNPKRTTGEQPAMPGNHPEFGVDQHWHNEAKSLDAAGYLADLLRAVPPGVGRVRFQHVGPAMHDP